MNDIAKINADLQAARSAMIRGGSQLAPRIRNITANLTRFGELLKKAMECAHLKNRQN